MKRLGKISRTISYCSASVLLVLWLQSAAMAATDKNTKVISLADQLVAQARQLESKQIDAAIQLLLSKEAEVVEQSSSRELARYYNKLSELNSTIGHLDEQQKFAEKGLSLLGNETVPIAAELYYNLGLVYEMRTEYVTARDLYDKGLHIAEATGNRINQGRGKLYIAALYTSQGQYSKAMSVMKEAYALSEELQDPELSWEVLNETGLLYSYVRDSEQAMEFHTRAIDVARKLDMKELTIVSLYNAAINSIELKRFDHANLLFEQMLVESKNSTEKSNMYSAYKGFALSANAAKQYERAFNYMTKAEEYLPYVQQVLLRVEHYMLKARLLNKLEQSNRAMEELAIAEQLLPEDQQGDKSGFGLSIMKLKAEFNFELRRFEQAYIWLDRYIKGFKAIRDKEKDAAEIKLRISFDMERSEVRNEMLEKDNKIKALQLNQAKSERQIQTFFLIALALLSLGLIFVMYRQLHARRKLKSIAETDELTGLFNRRYAFITGENLAKSNKQTPASLSIFIFDLDQFKAVNDTYGHPAGDEVLRTISQLSKACLRDTDIMARIGGEEFIAILPGVEKEMAEFIAGRLKEKLENFQQEYDGNKFFVTASFGVAMMQQDEDFESLTQRADKALYRAKDNGRNCVMAAD